MKSDSLFYTLFQTLPETLLMLAEADTTRSGEYRFQSVEVKDHAFRFDGVLALPEFIGHFFFAEVQYQKDKRFYTRLFAQIMTFLHQKQPQGSWRVVVIFPKRSIDGGLPEHFNEYAMSGRLKIVYLNELPPASLTQFPLTLLRLVGAPNRRSDVEAIVGEVLQSIPATTEPSRAKTYNDWFPALLPQNYQHFHTRRYAP